LAFIDGLKKLEVLCVFNKSIGVPRFEFGQQVVLSIAIPIKENYIGAFCTEGEKSKY